MDSAEDNELSERRMPAPDLPESGGELPLIDSQEFKQAFGQSLDHVLDLDTWSPGERLAELYPRLEQEVEEAARQGRRVRSRIRDEVFPKLRTRPGAPREAGVYQAEPADIERVHNGLLFNGAVEACDGTSDVQDTLPVTIAQIGICLVSYQGDSGSWVHRMFRRDLRVGGTDPVEEALELLERRRERSAFDTGSKRDQLSSLARRGIMAYAERAVLLNKSDAPWRMGHGNPAPYELITGSGMRELLEGSLSLLDELITGHKRFIFVPSSGNRMLLTIADALYPLEYAIVDTAADSLARIVERGHYRGEWADLVPKVEEFAREVGKQIVMGVFRASSMAPGQIFYAHAEHVHEAALIALADSALQEHRGFPMLIELADNVCKTTFGGDSLSQLTKLAYVEAGEPFRYLTERQTR